MSETGEQSTLRPAILSIGTANPKQRYSQEEVYALAAQHAEFYRSQRIEQIFLNSDIEYRHLYFDVAALGRLETVDELHERYRDGAVKIATEAIQQCLSAGKFSVSDIDYIVAVSCTGYLCPGLAELLIRELRLRNNVQRADLIGMGCAGAMPGLQRAYDFVSAYPERKVLVVTVEICSACYYFDDSLETVVGNAICADGAAAVVVGMSDESIVPKIVGFETHLEPSLINTVGFEQREGLLRIILSKDIRELAGKLSHGLINKLLQCYGVKKEKIAHWILHSGGRKVIDNIQKEVGLSAEQVCHSKYVLRNFGNMSSPTVLFVLKEAMGLSEHGNAERKPQVGDYGIMLALGPGVAVEGALLKW